MATHVFTRFDIYVVYRVNFAGLIVIILYTRDSTKTISKHSCLVTESSLHAHAQFIRTKNYYFYNFIVDKRIQNSHARLFRYCALLVAVQTLYFDYCFCFCISHKRLPCMTVVGVIRKEVVDAN